MAHRGRDRRQQPGWSAACPLYGPGDDYLVALAAARQAILVSGDRDLLDLSDEIPVFSPAAFLEQFAE